jgi:hypothetical protein
MYTLLEDMMDSKGLMLLKDTISKTDAGSF